MMEPELEPQAHNPLFSFSQEPLMWISVFPKKKNLFFLRPGTSNLLLWVYTTDVSLSSCNSKSHLAQEKGHAHHTHIQRAQGTAVCAVRDLLQMPPWGWTRYEEREEQHSGPCSRAASFWKGRGTEGRLGLRVPSELPPGCVACEPLLSSLTSLSQPKLTQL